MHRLCYLQHHSELQLKYLSTCCISRMSMTILICWSCCMVSNYYSLGLLPHLPLLFHTHIHIYSYVYVGCFTTYMFYVFFFRRYCQLAEMALLGFTTLLSALLPYFFTSASASTKAMSLRLWKNNFPVQNFSYSVFLDICIYIYVAQIYMDSIMPLNGSDLIHSHHYNFFLLDLFTGRDTQILPCREPISGA